MALVDSLLLNFMNRDSLTEEEQVTLRRLVSRDRHFDIDETIVTEGSRPQHSAVLLEGFAARYKYMADGTRQITALHVAGDFMDLHAFLLHTIDHGVIALSPCHVGFIDHAALREITEAHPHLTRLLWLDTVIDGAIHREWIVAMGRRSKRAHLAHLFCELFYRLQAVRKTVDFSFHFPLTQMELADVLGISVVHLNKTLQPLRRDGLLSWVNQTITILDWPRLTTLAQFDPTYLTCTVEPR